jgi:hypothetical protein
VENPGGEGFVEIATLPDEDDTAGEERRVRISPEGVVWSSNVQTALMEVQRLGVRGVHIADQEPTLAFYKGTDWPIPRVPDFGLALTSGTHLDSVPGTGQGTFIWEMHHKLEVRENGFFEKELEVGGQLTCFDRAVIQKDLTVMGNILSPLATGTKKGVVSVSVTGSGKFIIDAGINNGVLTLTRGSATVAELVAMLKAAGVSCSNILGTFGCSCSSGGCSCSAQGCCSSYYTCSECKQYCCTSEESRAAILSRFGGIEGFGEAFAAWEKELQGEVGEKEAQGDDGGRGTKGCTNMVEDANVLFEVMRRKIEALEARVRELEARTN